MISYIIALCVLSTINIVFILTFFLHCCPKGKLIGIQHWLNPMKMTKESDTKYNILITEYDAGNLTLKTTTNSLIFTPVNEEEKDETIELFVFAPYVCAFGFKSFRTDKEMQYSKPNKEIYKRLVEFHKGFNVEPETEHDSREVEL